jgi:hypothetical protein
MFEGDLSELSTADLLESAAEYRVLAHRADTRLLEVALVYADRYHPSAHPDRANRAGRRACDGRERAVVLGGDGCPEILEFAVAEFGVMLGISPGVATSYIGNAFALRHRFPFTWARVLAGEATPWKACRIVADCSKLSQEAAAYVDRRVAGIVDSISPYRLDQIVTAAKMHADPASARAEAAEKARERGVFIGQADKHGTTTMYIKAATGAVARNNARLAAIADALQILGDTRPLQARRADAVGIIADSLFTEELIAQARQYRLSRPATDIPDTTSTAEATDTREPGSAPQTAAPETIAPDPSGASPSGADPSGASPSGASPGGAADTFGAGSGMRSEPHWGDDDLLRDWMHDRDEPGADDNPDDSGDGDSMEAAARRALHARLAQIRRDAYTCPAHPSGGSRTELYVHLTDLTLATGTGVLRIEGLGPMIADQLTELVGHGPYIVKPVIDLNDAVSVNAYEIPDRIRERVKLTHPVELFPFGTRETSRSIDLDHIRPFDPLGPPGQTSTPSLAPLSRYGHRVKTHAQGWDVHRVDYRTLEWTTPHGFRFHVDPRGTRRIRKDE